MADPERSPWQKEIKGEYRTDHDRQVQQYPAIRSGVEMRSNIESGRWLPKQRIPSESELVEAYGVSRITVRRAIDELVKEGALKDVRRGRNVRCPAEAPHRFTTLTSFTQELIEKGLRPGTKILDFRIIPACADLARHLRISLGSEVVRIERQRFADGEAVALNLSHVPHRLCMGISEDEVGPNSLYKLLEVKYGLYIKKASRDFETVEAGRARPDSLMFGKGSDPEACSTVSTGDDIVVDYCTGVLK